MDNPPESDVSFPEGLAPPYADVPFAPPPPPVPPPLPPRFWQLFNTSDGAWRYIRRAAILSFVPSVALAITLQIFVGGMDKQPVNEVLGKMNKGIMLLFVLVLAPIGETLVMAGIIGLLRFTRKPKWLLAIASAFIWALFHIPNGGFVPFVVAWPFFVFSSAYLAWRPRGWFRAIGVTAAIHFLQNLMPGLAVLAS